MHSESQLKDLEENTLNYQQIFTSFFGNNNDQNSKNLLSEFEIKAISLKKRMN